MTRLAYTVLLILFCPLLAVSQQFLKGQVRDESGTALQNAAIFQHSTRLVYYTGSDGSFIISTQRRSDTITVSYEGFQQQKLLVTPGEFMEIRLRKSTGSGNWRVYKLSSLTQDLKRETQQTWFTGDETYASLVENQFVNAAQYGTTGVSLNVDRAAYSNVRRFLTMNSAVPPDAVRLEEMINYFNFAYTEPPAEKTFGVQSLLTDCPWNKNNFLLYTQVNSRKLDLDSLPSSNLVFLIDISGSMDMPNRLPLLKSGFKALVNNLRAKDSVSIVVYGGSVGIALPITGGDQKDTILKVIDSLQPGGSTNGESGIKLAYSMARLHFIKGGNNRIILATDGDFNVGLKTDEELEEMIMKEREAGIYLTCLGVGMGNYKDSKILTLAQKGNGNFAYIDSYAEAEKVLLKEFMQTLFTVADDAYFKVSFDPSLVKEYRLLGFDNKMGAIRDAGATVEGGEIGPAYSSLVAFEIVPTEKGASVLRNRSSHRVVRMTLQYKLPSQNIPFEVEEQPLIAYQAFNDIPKSYQFASSVLMFGGLLRKSRFMKDVTWGQIWQIASAAADPGIYSHREFVQLVEKAKVVYGRKKRK